VSNTVRCPDCNNWSAIRVQISEEIPMFLAMPVKILIDDLITSWKEFV